MKFEKEQKCKGGFQKLEKRMRKGAGKEYVRERFRGSGAGRCMNGEMTGMIEKDRVGFKRVEWECNN